MSLQVTEKRSGYLAFETGGERNKLWAFFALLAFAMALVCLGVFVNRATYRETLTCQRTDVVGSCESRRQSLFRDHSESVGLGTIAAVEYDAEADPPTLRVLGEEANLALPIEDPSPRTRANGSDSSSPTSPPRRFPSDVTTRCSGPARLLHSSCVSPAVWRRCG